MELPSSSGTFCYAIEDDDVVIENIVIKNADSKMAAVGSISLERPNDLSTKVQDIIERLNSSNACGKSSILLELRACFDEKSLDEFTNIFFQSVNIIIEEKNSCTLCQETFNSSHENMAHIILVHNVHLNCSIFLQMVNQRAEPKISNKNTVPVRSKPLPTDGFNKFLQTCNRARNRRTRIKKYDILRKKYKVNLKVIHNKMLSNMFYACDKLWICKYCKMSYKLGPTLARHLFVEHRFVLEFGADNNKFEIENKVEFEKNVEDHKPENIRSSVSVNKGVTNTIQPPPMDNTKKFSLFLVYFAKSFPVTNLQLLRELFEKLNYDISIFEDFTKNQNKTVELIKRTISSNFIKYLVNDVGESTYSILIHLNEDKTLLLLIIKYYSNRTNRISTSFYRLMHMQSDNYALQIIDILKVDGLSIEKCTGFGLDISDEDDNLTDSVINILGNVKSRVAINRCIFKSLQIVIRKACFHLSENLAIMIEGVHTWYTNFGSNSESKKNFTQLKNIEAKTVIREWFTEIQFIEFIICQWNILKQELISKNNCLSRYIFQNLYQSDENLHILNYIHGTLKPVIDLHETFLKEAFEPSDLFIILSNIVSNLYIKPQIKHESVPNELLISMQKFIHHLILELQKLIPKPSSVLHQMSFLTPESTKSTKRMQCLPFSNGEVARIIDHVVKFINDANSQVEQVPVETMEIFLILRCQNETSFLDL